jgi:hypothetical protein
MKFADVRPVFVPMLRRTVTRCRACKAAGPDHLLICRLSAGLLSGRPKAAPRAECGGSP